MRFLQFTLLLLVMVSTSAQAYSKGWQEQQWEQNRDRFVVKVKSKLSAQSDTEMEGTGIAFFHDGKYLVLTSEHVVFGNNNPATHEVLFPRDSQRPGFQIPAKWVKSSWTRGVSLLRLEPETEEQRRSLSYQHLPSLELLEGHAALPREYDFENGAHHDVSKPLKKIERVSLRAVGIPAGAEELRHMRATSTLEIHAPGFLIATNPTYTIDGLTPEFGMSGGPVFLNPTYYGPSSLLGFLTHVSYGEQIKTFIMPTDGIFGRNGWVSVNFEDQFFRTAEDLQKQASDPDLEIVRHRGGNLIFERRGSNFYVQRDYRQPTRVFDSLNSGIYNLDQYMTRNNFTRLILFRNAPHYSLGQLVRTLLQPNVNLTGTPDEGPPTETPPSVQVKQFGAHFLQRVFYKVVRTRRQTVLVRNPNGTLSRTSRPMTQEWSLSVTYSTSSSDYELRRRPLQAQYFYQGVSTMNQDQQFVDIPEPSSSDLWYRRRATCVLEGGRLEVIRAGNRDFETCKKTENGMHVWYGPVYVTGIVKREALNGSYSEIWVGENAM